MAARFGALTILFYFTVYLLQVKLEQKIHLSVLFHTSLDNSPSIANIDREGLFWPKITSARNTNLKSAARRISRNPTSQVRWTKRGHMCLWLPDISLVYDLEINPGTMEKKPNCSICERTVRSNQAAIVCGNCDSCFHAKCSGLAKAALNKLHDSAK